MADFSDYYSKKNHRDKSAPSDINSIHDGRIPEGHQNEKKPGSPAVQWARHSPSYISERIQLLTEGHIDHIQWVNLSTLSGIFTVTLLVVLGLVIWRYDKRKVLTEGEENVFYAVTEALIIFVGLKNNVSGPSNATLGLLGC